MSSPPLRQRVVDDTDLAIQYVPNSDWFSADASTLTAGNWGPIYRESSHATTSNANLTFAFNGTDIQVRGTIDISKNSTTNVTDPTWDCFVDDMTISKPNPTFQFAENNWVLCEQSALDASFDTAVLFYPSTDPSVSFGSGWNTFGGENETNDHGSQVSLSFHGTSVIPFAFVPNQLPPNATWATYAIDDGEPVNFTLNGLPSPQSSTEFHVPLFTTPTLPSALHTLVITYGGDDHHTPLVIQGFYVTNTTTVSSDPSSPSLLLRSFDRRVVGGIVFLALFAALAFFYSKHRRHRRPDFTAANPYPLPMAYNDGVVHDQPYGHYPVTAIAPRSKPGAAMVASNGFGSGPSTKFPYTERLAPAPQQQSNGSPPAVVVVHEDSGVRLPPEQALEPRIVELPPGYSPE
ncbi:hypothetical protein MSAN_00103600 [Mycena sanguinolenta]|uniref:Transmembrane protein n=1 Tax=Mycena sanguinolenta TaxID=230812 RepID=A0A8H6ZHB6_9AGAR|nr:hypothetical protein MSAN_00103600 [Mycena sanguinolenta]